MSGASADSSSTTEAPGSKEVQPAKPKHAADIKLDRIIADILPSAPYLLRLEPPFAQARYTNSYWQRDTPFAADEEELQYVTFIPDHHGSLLRAHGNWDDGKGAIAPPEDLTSRTSSGRTSQAGPIVKKKITLADYKNRDKNKKPPTNSDTALAKATEGAATSKPAAAPPEQHSTDDRKGAQSASQVSLKGQPESAQHLSKDLSDAPLKKTPNSLSTDPAVEKLSEESQTAAPEPPIPKDCKKSEKAHTDHAAIAVALPPAAPIASPRAVPDGSRKRSNDDMGGATSPSVAKKPRLSPEQPRNTKATDPQIGTNGIPPLLSPTLPSDVCNPPPIENILPPLLSPTLPSECEAELASLQRRNEPQHTEKKETPRQTSSKVAILKVKNKANRKQLSQYLKLKSTPHALAHYLPEISQSSGLAPNQKASKGIAAPQPVTPAGPSRGYTPATASRSGESPERQKWVARCRSLTKQYLDLGKQLKHESDSVLRAHTNIELGVVIATESVLCFILAASINDEPARSSNQLYTTDLWRSIPTFIEYIAKTHARPFQHLYGLLNQLLAIVNDTLHYSIDLRLHAVYREYGRSKGAGTPLEFDDPEEFLTRKLSKILRDLYEASTRARSAWAEGMLSLWHTDIASGFPKTYAKQRDHSGPGKGKEPLDIDDLSKNGFSLPLSTCTTGMESVLFGLSFLNEYKTREKVAWKRKLKI